MNFAYLILGSNIGDSLEILQSAVIAIETEVGDVAAKSDYYFTKAWGNTNQPDFINQVVKVETDLLPKELLEKILLIEKKAGRIRGEVKWQQRTLDIDILFYNDFIIEEPDLIIPHPYIQERNFVLIPLSEIAKDFVHPVLKKTILQLCEDCKDGLEVKKGF
jgi:2-amino-4-hydroxy-6-hydroxymethyldihydropteridine diphosphokinase